MVISMKRLLVLVSLVCFVAACSSNKLLVDNMENRSKQADRYLKVANMKKLMEDVAKKSALNYPAETREKLISLLTTHLNIKSLEKSIKKSMVKHFTAQELQAMAIFYGTPEGKSILRKFGAYTADIMPAVQAEIMSAQWKATAEFSNKNKKKLPVDNN